MPVAKSKFYLRKQKSLIEKAQALEVENEKKMFVVGKLEKRVSDLEQHMNPDLRSPMDKRKMLRECSACEQRLFKELENSPAIRELQDQVEKYRYCFLESKNQNMLLKRDLQIAKKVICQELGIQSVDFPELMRHATEEGWKGRREKVLLLQNKNFELKDKLQEKGPNNMPQSSPSEEYAKQNISEDRKTYWRLELEKRKAFEMADKEKNDLIEELLSLRKKLHNGKSRNKELIDEVTMLRGELYAMTDKAKEDTGLISSMRNLEQELHEAMNDRCELRRLWDGAKTRNQLLDDQISHLKGQIAVLKDKNDEDCEIIQSLTQQQQRLQALLEREQMLNHQQAERYKDDLRKMQANHADNISYLERMQFALDEKSSLVETLQQQVAEDAIQLEKLSKKRSMEEEEGEEDEDELEASESKEKDADKEKEEGEEEGEEGEAEEKLKAQLKDMQMEIAKFKALYEATQQDSESMAQIISDLHKKSDDLTLQVLESQRLTLQRDMEYKELQTRLKKVQQDVKDKKRKKAWEKAKPPPPIAKTKAEELNLKLEVMTEENDFLRNFLSTAIAAKQEDFHLYRTITDKAKQHFETSLDEIKTELTQKEEPPEGEGEDEEDEEEEEDEADD